MNSKQLNSTRPAIILCASLGLVCVVLLILNARSRENADKLKGEAATLQAKLDAANLKVVSMTDGDVGSRSPEERKGTPPSLTKPRSAPATIAAAANSERKRRVNADDVTAMVKSPMMQKIMASQTSAVMQMTYGDLMSHFQLSPEERDYLQRLLVEKQTSLQNLGIQLMNPSLTDDARNAIKQQLGEAWKAGEAKIHDFLNDDADFAYYQTYSRQEPERKEVGMFEASLTGGDSLDPATSDALANLQSEARKSFPFTVDFYDQRNFGNPAVLNTASVHKFLDEQTQFQAQVAEKAADMLTPERLQVFKQNQAAVRQMAGMQLNSMVQMAGGSQ